MKWHGANFLLWVGGALGLNLLLVALAYGLGAVVTHRALENYQWRIDHAIQRGDLDGALKIAEERGAEEYYDFVNHRAWAEALLEKGMPTEAVDLLIESLDRGQRAAGRDVFTRGYNPVATYMLLQRALRAAGRVEYAGEMGRLLADLEGKTARGAAETTDSLQGDPVQWLNVGVARRENGCVFSEGVLRFDRNSTATLGIPAHALALVIEYRGCPGGGLGALLRVSFRGKELIQLYGNSQISRQVTVPLMESDENGGEVKLSFINDFYERISKADRNFEVLKIGFKEKNLR